MDRSDHLQTQIFMLTDWQSDTWTRVYCKILKNAAFSYTFDRNDVKENKAYPNVIRDVHSALLKKDKVKERPRSPKADTRDNSVGRVGAMSKRSNSINLTNFNKVSQQTGEMHVVRLVSEKG